MKRPKFATQDWWSPYPVGISENGSSPKIAHWGNMFPTLVFDHAKSFFFFFFSRLLLTVCFCLSLFPVQSSQGVLDLLMVLRVLRLVKIMGQIKRFVSTLTVQTARNVEKDVFRLVTSVRQRKNYSPWGVEPQTFGFCAPMLYLWAIETLWARPITKFMHDTCRAYCLDQQFRWRHEVRLFLGTRNIFCLTHVTTRKSIFLYFLTELKSYHLS